MINVAEILKDCPKGMELDCVLCNGVKFIELDRNPNYPIVVMSNNGYEFSLTKYGQIYNIDDTKCVIFPKGKTTWEGFQRPFKAGDIVVTTLNNIAIIKKPIEGESFFVYGLMVGNEFYKDEAAQVFVKRLATEEEKQKLLDAIKANGYKWNAVTKTLEKLIEPKFKVGDRIRSVISSSYYTVVSIEENSFYIKSDTEPFPYKVALNHERNYELAPDKFDISTLEPFESKVLVRDKNTDEWRGRFFSHYYHNGDRPYVCIGVEGISEYMQCIPYAGNEHLLGKTDDCDEYYKTWLEK